MRKFVLVVAAVGLLAGACGDDKRADTASSSDDTTTTAAASESKAGGSDKLEELTDACSLFTSDQISAFVGLPVNGGVSSRYGTTLIQGAKVQSSCRWTQQGSTLGGTAIELGLIEDFATAAAFLDTQVGMGYVEVDGLGEKATRPAGGSQVSVITEQLFISVVCGTAQGDPERRLFDGCVLPIAKELVSRLA